MLKKKRRREEEEKKKRRRREEEEEKKKRRRRREEEEKSIASTDLHVLLQFTLLFITARCKEVLVLVQQATPKLLTQALLYYAKLWLTHAALLCRLRVDTQTKEFRSSIIFTNTDIFGP